MTVRKVGYRSAEQRTVRVAEGQTVSLSVSLTQAPRRAAKSAAKVLGVNDPYTREYAKFLDELKSGHAITMPAVEFRRTFVSGNKVVEQGPR